MKYKEWRDPTTLSSFCQISISDFDLVHIPLYDFDKKLLEECSKSNSVADKLLALETIARRLEQLNPNKPEEDSDEL